MTSPGDVGGWFRTAQPQPKTSATAWGPRGQEFGRRSPDSDLERALALFVGRPTMVLTGAGMSTASGLPDYRGRDAVPRSPMTFQEFVGSDLSRRRYWARATVGWRAFCSAQPNSAHRALAQLGEHTPLTGVVTQNVDGLHQAAGSHPVIDLHGNLHRVGCLSCGRFLDRSQQQDVLLALNPRFATHLDELAQEARTAPDGDAEVDRTEDFRYPDCPSCGGMLKPDVVYFGENVRKEVTKASNDMLDSSEVLLVLGTSLTVMSGLRFLRRSAKEGRPIVILNDGSTRGDELATIRLHGSIAPVLESWVAKTSH